MALAQEFEYYRPKTLKVALDILDEFGKGARVLAGGTDLVNNLRDDLDDPKALVDIKRIKELGRIEERGGSVRIGAAVCFNELLQSEAVRRKLPLLWEAAGHVASYGLRNRATMIGNICSAVPCADSGPPLLVYDAKILLIGQSGPRTVPAAEWFLANRKTAIRPGEIVVGAEIPAPKKHGSCYVKLMRYKGEDLAQASVGALALPGKEYRVAFGSAAPVPKRAWSVEAHLSGKSLTPAVLEKAKKLAARETSPITDIRATKEYRQHMLGVMLERALDAAASRLAGKGPRLGERQI